MFRLAMIQMHVTGGEKQHNLSHASQLIAEAAKQGAQVALLPETMDLGWTDPSAKTEAEPIPNGQSCQALCAAARQHQLYVCAGLVENDGNAVFNTAVLIDPQGEVILRHRKLNELDIGHAYYGQGDRLGVAHTPLGTIGLMICADGFAPGQIISRTLGYMGADVILSPSAWATPADHDNNKTPYGDEWRNCYKPVARDFHIWIIGVSNVGWVMNGPWKGRKCIGASLAIGPDGREVLQAPYGVDAETTIYLDIEPLARPTRGCGWIEMWQKNTPDSEEDYQNYTAAINGLMRNKQ